MCIMSLSLCKLLIYHAFDPTRARVVFVLCSFMFKPLDLSCYELYGPDACLIWSTLPCASSALGSWSKLDLDQSKGCRANGWSRIHQGPWAWVSVAEFRFLANLLLFYTLLSLFTPLHASKLCQKILKKLLLIFLHFLINLGILHVNFDQRSVRKLCCLAYLFSFNFCWKSW